MDIGVLIGIVISIVIGVALIPTVNETINALDTTNMSSATLSLIKILPIIVVTLLVVGSVGYFVMISGSGTEDRKEKDWDKHWKEVHRQSVEKYGDNYSQQMISDSSQKLTQDMIVAFPKVTENLAVASMKEEAKPVVIEKRPSAGAIKGYRS